MILSLCTASYSYCLREQETASIWQREGSKEMELTNSWVIWTIASPQPITNFLSVVDRALSGWAKGICSSKLSLSIVVVDFACSRKAFSSSNSPSMVEVDSACLSKNLCSSKSSSIVGVDVACWKEEGKNTTRLEINMHRRLTGVDFPKMVY